MHGLTWIFVTPWAGPVREVAAVNFPLPIFQSANFDLPVCFASPSATIKFTKEKVQEER